MDELCTTCLCAGRDLQYLEDTEYYQMYSQIMNENLQPGVRVCWECCAVLRRFQQFQRQARRCQMLMSEQSTPKYLLCQPPRLSAQLVDNTSYPPLIVKTEPTDASEPTAPDHVTTKFMYKLKVERGDTMEHCEPDMFVDGLKFDKHEDQDLKEMNQDDTIQHCESVMSEDDLESEDQDQTKETVNISELNSLPEKSHLVYIRAFDQFNEWRHKKGAKGFSETVLLSYFTELASCKKPTSLWSVYSMLKATLKVKRNVHIEKYPKLTAFLKKSAAGHVPQQSKTFTAEEVERFLHEAPDRQYLAAKVAVIVGISGGCRTNELTNLMTNDVEKHSDALLLFKLRDSKTNIERNFVVRDEYAKIIDKYQKLRPANTSIDRFFLGYRSGRCVNQPIGSNKIGSFPREIATFLGLPSAKQYTGHCFRRTAATLLSSSADLTTLQRHSGRYLPPGDVKSPSVGG